MLRHHANVRENRHEVRIATPSGDDVTMRMLGEARTGGFTDIEAQVQPIAPYCGAQARGGLTKRVHQGCVLAFAEFEHIAHVSPWENEQVASSDGIAVEADEGVRKTSQDMLSVEIRRPGSRHGAQNAAGGLGPKDVLHAPGGPNGRLHGGAPDNNPSASRNLRSLATFAHRGLCVTIRPQPWRLR
jgi:hypothetical protein